MPIMRARVPMQARRLTNYRRVRGMRGLGDCLISAQSEGLCPDGSPYLGTLDSGGAAPTLSFPYVVPGTVPASTAPGSTSGPSVTSLIAGMIPAGFTTLQEAIAQPGQVVKTPTTLITGSGTNLATIPGLSTVTSSTGLMIGALVIGGLVLFSVLGKK